MRHCCVLLRWRGKLGSGAPKTIRFESGGKSFTKSSAILRIFSALGGHWKVLAGMGFLIPRFLRDTVYDVVAKNRYKWFGKADMCGLPDEELLKRLER